MMYKYLKKRNFYLTLLLDSLAMFASLYLAYALRFDFHIPEQHLRMMQFLFPIVLVTKLSFFAIFRLYQGMWRYTGMEDLLNVFKAALAGTLSLIFLILMLYRFQDYSRSVFLIDFGFTVFFAAGLRVGIRVYFSSNLRYRFFPFMEKGSSDAKRLLIIGAGDTGEKVIREMLENPSLKFLPVGFLDDDRTKHGRTIHGIRVLGAVEQLTDFQNIYDEILIALTAPHTAEMSRIIAICRKSGRRFRRVPAMDRFITGHISAQPTIQDILKREEISLEKKRIAEYLCHKRVLITGAGGSIGSELVRQIRAFEPETLALFEMSEFNLFQISMECCGGRDDSTVSGFLADIRDVNTVNRVFEQFHPQVVFHTAAYKHVPIQERFPWEAIHNNIQGSVNLIEAAQTYQVEKFVFVSSDKAVRPSSVMGATKRVVEKLIASANTRSFCQFMTVRFGNVIGSSGSVIPVFQDQIARGGPVTVTHPDVVRYFMSIPEAAQLILQAGSMGEGGEIFILEMGKAIRIADLAKDLIQFYGYEPDKQIEIRYTGLRPGEKLYEELFTEEEHFTHTRHQNIMVLQNCSLEQRLLQEQINRLQQASQSYNGSKIKQILQEIVPEYRPEDSRA